MLNFDAIQFRARLAVAVKVFANRLRYLGKMIGFNIVRHFSLAFLNSCLAFLVYCFVLAPQFDSKLL